MGEVSIVKMEYGSRLYGTTTPASDTDYASVYMPSLQDLLLQKVSKGKHQTTGNNNSRNTSDDVDEVSYPLPRFIQLCLAGDTTALDMLHCESPLSSTAIWEELVSKRTMFYTSNMKAYAGYVKSQALKYGVKGDKVSELIALLGVVDYIISSGEDTLTLDNVQHLLPNTEYTYFSKDTPAYIVLGRRFELSIKCTYFRKQLKLILDGYGVRSKQAAENGGIDWKAVHHALRVLYQVEDVFTNGDFSYPLKQTPFLMRVKRGEADYLTEIAPVFDTFLDNIEEMSKSSGLPDKPDVLYWEEWLLNLYKEYFNL